MGKTRKVFGRWETYDAFARDWLAYHTEEDYATETRPVVDGIATEDELILASYGGGLYDGDAFVLFERDGTLYEVHGSHCSCHGLEGQWAPEATTWEVVAARPWSKPIGDYACPLCEHDDDALERMRAILAEREAPHA